MSDIIGIIATVEDDSYQGKAHKKVTLEDGQVLKVKYGREGALKAKWGLLSEGVAMKFTMKDFTTGEGVKIPFVADIATVEGKLPAPQPPAPELVEHQQEVAKVTEDPRTQDIHFQVAIKEVGLGWREGRLPEDDEHPIERKMVAKYKNTLCKWLGIQVEYK